MHPLQKADGEEPETPVDSGLEHCIEFGRGLVVTSSSPESLL